DGDDHGTDRKASHPTHALSARLFRAALLVQRLQRLLHLGCALVVPVDRSDQVREGLRRPVSNQFDGAVSPLEEGNRFLLLYSRHFILTSCCKTKRRVALTGQS